MNCLLNEMRHNHECLWVGKEIRFQGLTQFSEEGEWNKYKAGEVPWNRSHKIFEALKRIWVPILRKMWSQQRISGETHVIWFIFSKSHSESVMVTYVCNCSTQEAKAGGLWGPDQHGPHKEFHTSLGSIARQNPVPIKSSLWRYRIRKWCNHY
jgi:hypothetical protein